MLDEIRVIVLSFDDCPFVPIVEVKMGTGALIGIIAGSLCFILIVTLICCKCRKKQTTLKRLSKKNNTAVTNDS